MLRQFILLCMVTAVAHAEGGAPAGLSSSTRLELEKALACVNLSVEDLGWDKRPISDDWRLSVVNETLDRPLQLAVRAEQAERELGVTAQETVMHASAWLDVQIEHLDIPTGRLPDLRGITEAEYVASAMASAGWNKADVREAQRFARSFHRTMSRAYRRTEKFPTQDLAELMTWSLGFYRTTPNVALAPLSDDERAIVVRDAAKLYTADEEWETAALMTASRKVDLRRLFDIAFELTRLASSVTPELRASVMADRSRPRSVTRHGVTVLVGTSGADTFHDVDIVLDPGGSDNYERVKVVIDLAGDDTYRDCGSGLLDFGLILDSEGNDRYLGGNFAQGGAAFGVSLLLDEAGDDSYQADQISQGAAFYGLGLLRDESGNDSYRGARFVQGFGGVKGIGILSDRSGHDTYWAGGKYSHAPLLPENFQSLSQGFGFGLRPDASGGVGVLIDGAGNDSYHAEVFGQGASYWFALGMLIDSSGHDKYDLYQYGQGAGIHLSPGVLMDRAGNDAYSCNNGVAQGSGHDWGVGLLWDRAGNDYYQGSGMSQGGANANAIGMILDEGGNDAYSGTGDKNQGDSFFSRGSIGLGVLLDMAGKDKYTHGGSEGATWTRGTVGVGRDVPDPEPKP